MNPRFAVIFLVLLGVFLLGVSAGTLLTGKGYPGSLLEGAPISVDLRIEYGEEDAQAFLQQEVPSGTTVLGLLEAVEERHGVPVETREFSGLGTFVEAIHGVRNTDSSYWQYWVSGEYGQVGASQTLLKEGDEVLWKRTDKLPE